MGRLAGRVALAIVSAKKRRRGVGMARQLEHFDNLVALFLTRAAEKGDKPFLWAKRDGEWRSTSWAEAARQVAALAAGLKRIGLQPGDRVALVSENRPEWLIADLGIMAAGCVTVPTYTTNTTRDHAHVLDNSGARAVIVSSQKLANNLMPAVLTSSECHHFIGIDEIRRARCRTGPRPSLARAASGEADVEALQRRSRASAAAISPASSTPAAPAGRRAEFASPRRNPPQRRRLHRHHLDRLRLGRRSLPVLPSGKPRL